MNFIASIIMGFILAVGILTTWTGLEQIIGAW